MATEQKNYRIVEILVTEPRDQFLARIVVARFLETRSAPLETDRQAYGQTARERERNARLEHPVATVSPEEDETAR